MVLLSPPPSDCRQPFHRSICEWRVFSCHHHPSATTNPPPLLDLRAEAVLLLSPPSSACQQPLRCSICERRWFSCHHHPLTVNKPSVAQFASGGCFFAATTPLQPPTPLLLELRAEAVRRPSTFAYILAYLCTSSCIRNT